MGQALASYYFDLYNPYSGEALLYFFLHISDTRGCLSCLVNSQPWNLRKVCPCSSHYAVTPSLLSIACYNSVLSVGAGMEERYRQWSQDLHWEHDRCKGVRQKMSYSGPWGVRSYGLQSFAMLGKSADMAWGFSQQKWGGSFWAKASEQQTDCGVKGRQTKRRQKDHSRKIFAWIQDIEEG